MTKIKICGIHRMEDIAYVNEARPEYIGFVFAPSKRQVTKEQARNLKKQLRPEIEVVGVFVNAKPEAIEYLCKMHIIDMVQLHGDENDAYIRELRKRVSNPIIRAVRVQSKEQVLQAEELSSEYLLLDTYVANEYGGSGQELQLQLLPKLQKPYFLAGGLTPQNVAKKISIVYPYAVDISSGVETNGVKDFNKIKEFIYNVRKGAVK